MNQQNLRHLGGDHLVIQLFSMKKINLNEFLVLLAVLNVIIQQFMDPLVELNVLFLMQIVVLHRFHHVLLLVVQMILNQLSSSWTTLSSNERLNLQIKTRTNSKSYTLNGFVEIYVPSALLKIKVLKNLHKHLFGLVRKFSQNSIDLEYSLLFLGAQYGLVDVKELLRSRQTVARTVNDLALKYRADLKNELVEPLKSKSVTICPDFWSNKYNQQAFLGLNITFVTINYEFKCVDLFCIPFNGVKSYDLILEVSFTGTLCVEKLFCFHCLFILNSFRFPTDAFSFIFIGSSTIFIWIWHYRFIGFEYNDW